MEQEQSTFEDLPADAARMADAIQEAERAGKERSRSSAPACGRSRSRRTSWTRSHTRWSSSMPRRSARRIGVP